MNEMYHYVYKITCTIDDRWYIGIHSTKNLLDGYLGSGRELGKSKRQHGREKHVIEILTFCDSRAEVLAYERELVTWIVLADPDCMNLTPGGGGGWEAVNAKKTRDDCVAAGKLGSMIGANKHLEMLKDEKYLSEHRRKLIDGVNKWYTTLSDNDKRAMTSTARLASTSVECIEKRKKKFKEIAHQSGTNNSQFGKMWISNLEEKVSKCVPKYEILEYPWVKGRNAWNRMPL